MASAPDDEGDLDALIEQSHHGLDAFFRGNPEPMKPLMSHRDDVSLANPFGPPRRGWNEVEEAMDRAATNYREGGVIRFEQVSKYIAPGLAYLVEIEHYQAKVGGSDEVTPVSLRCTTVFRQEDDAWKIVHRHADPITSPRSAESVVRG